MASTVLPNGIIIPEKYSRDWYADLYHNWQELDNLLGGGANDGTLTIQKNGTTVGTFSANQATDETINIEVPTKTSDLTNDSGFITSDNTKIPLAGSNAISGSLIPATDNTVNLGSDNRNYSSVYAYNFPSFIRATSPSDTTDIFLIAGTNIFYGAYLQLSPKDATSGSVAGSFRLTARDTNSQVELVGTPDGTLTWNGQPIQTSSDKRLKQQISQIDDALLDAWEDVEPSQFKYNDAVNEKGDKARLHTGYVVQQIDKACQSHGVDISAYGLYCHEEYPEETEEVEVEQADGTKTKERKVIREANEHYSLRYTEVYAVECMYLRRCIERLTARIEELEKGNNTK